MARGWKHHIDLHDIWQDDDPDFELRRSLIVQRIRGSLVYDAFRADDRLEDILNELDDTETEDDFDWVWSDFYDWADDNRVWIELWTPVVKPVQEDLQRLLTELKGP